MTSRILMMTLGLAPVLAAAGPAHACNDCNPLKALGLPGKTTAGPAKKVSVEELAALMAGKAAPTVLDANPQDVRNRLGMVPSAVALTSFANYDLQELPADKGRTLVFYCYNEQCTASHTAAARAVEAGHTDVLVMHQGIVGWVAAGHPVAHAGS